LSPGSHLALVQLADSEQDPNELLSTTKYVLNTHDIGLYAYDRNLAYCAHCQKTFYGILPKCPTCGSVDMLVFFSRVGSRFRAVRRV